MRDFEPHRRRMPATQLWENKEALRKYLDKLREYWDESTQSWRDTPVSLSKNKMETSNRRNRLDLMSAAEKSIYDAMQEVEKMPPHVLLTDAIILLGKAKDAVSDYIDSPES